MRNSAIQTSCFEGRLVVLCPGISPGPIGIGLSISIEGNLAMISTTPCYGQWPIWAGTLHRVAGEKRKGSAPRAPSEEYIEILKG